MTATEEAAETLALAGIVSIDARHAGGSIIVDVDESPGTELFGVRVRLEIPGIGPIPLYPREARALAAALNAAAARGTALIEAQSRASAQARSASYAKQKNAPDALERGEGDDQNPNS